MNRSSTYAADVTGRLGELREAGVETFAAAWQRVMAEMPAPWSWRGRLQPELDDDEPPVEFLRRQCARAWAAEGEAPAIEIRALLEGMADRSRAAVGKGARR